MRWYNITTVILSYIVLAAHFLRPGNIFLALVSLGIPFLLLIRRRLALRIVQTGLYAGGLVWLATLGGYIIQYSNMGRDMTRMIIIILSVTGFTLLSAILLNAKSVLGNYTK